MVDQFHGLVQIMFMYTYIYVGWSNFGTHCNDSFLFLCSSFLNRISTSSQPYRHLTYHPKTYRHKTYCHIYTTTHLHIDSSTQLHETYRHRRILTKRNVTSKHSLRLHKTHLHICTSLYRRIYASSYVHIHIQHPS